MRMDAPLRRWIKNLVERLKALRDLDNGCPWALAGAVGERAAGNGAAMRIAPLAFTSADRQLIRDVARITHHHEEAYVGALAVVLAIRQEEIAPNLPDSVVRDRLQTPGTSGYVADSVPAALWHSQQILRNGFHETLQNIIQNGGDTDTIASIAGQIAGAHLGYRRLPQDLLARLPERELILGISTRFASRWASPPRKKCPDGPL